MSKESSLLGSVYWRRWASMSPWISAGKGRVGFPSVLENILGGLVEESLIRSQVGCPPPLSPNSCRVILGSLMEELLNAFSAGS
jgi:hypothetical protein